MKNSTNLGQNSLNSNANFWAKLKALFALPKWAKIFLGVLSVVAVAGLLGAFALQSWAKDKIQHGEFVLNGTDKSWQKRLESGFAYDSRLYFEKADFLLRSKVIAYIDIRDISWVSPIDKNAVSELKSGNRHIKFSTSQNLSEFNGQRLGIVEYKMDFSPLLKTIVKYYLIILFAVYLGFILCKVLGIDKIVEFLNQNSLPQALWQGYKAINPLYRHTFWIVFIALNLVFGFHTVQFLWGNHDWGAVYHKLGFWAYLGMGRYTQNLIHLSLLQGGMMLPFLNNIIGFIGFALGVVWFCIYFNIQRKLWIWTIIGLLLTLQPFTLARMYYADQFSGLFISFAIFALGFVLAKNASDMCKQKAYITCLISILCIHWAMASYQPFIDTATIFLCGGIISIMIDEQVGFKTALYKSRFIIISILFGVLSYKIVFDILKQIGKVGEFYNNQMVAFDEIPERILLAIKLGFGNLVNFESAFMPLYMTILFAVFIIIFIGLLFVSPLKQSAKVSIIVLFCGAVLASQAHNVISQTISNYDGIHYYGLLFARVLIIALVFKLFAQFTYRQNLIQNLCFVLSIVIIWVCVVQDLYAQRVQKLAFDAEFRLLNRVIDRIEQNENFSYGKQYCGIMFGEVPNMRLKFYSDKAKQNDSTALLHHTLITPWDPSRAFNSTLSKNIFAHCDFYSSSHYKDDKNIQTLISRLENVGILDTLEPFPHKNSVVVFENIIVFVASQGNLDEIKTIAKNLKKNSK